MKIITSLHKKTRALFDKMQTLQPLFNCLFAGALLIHKNNILFANQRGIPRSSFVAQIPLASEQPCPKNAQNNSKIENGPTEGP